MTDLARVRRVHALEMAEGVTKESPVGAVTPMPTQHRDNVNLGGSSTQMPEADFRWAIWH